VHSVISSRELPRLGPERPAAVAASATAPTIVNVPVAPAPAGARIIAGPPPGPVEQEGPISAHERAPADLGPGRGGAAELLMSGSERFARVPS